MKRRAGKLYLVWSLAAAISVVLGLLPDVRGDETARPDIPAPLAPLEYLIGRWKGRGVPKDNAAKRFQGWSETHVWAWSFTQGKPSGLTLTIEGGKILASARLTYDETRGDYRLEGVEPRPSNTRVAYEGRLDKSSKHLELEYLGETNKAGKPAGVLRLAIWPNANFIRYIMAHELKEPGSAQFSRLIEVGLTKEGESLAGSSASAERPKCIVTGGAATMTLSYQGRAFPICCTGCRDEFNENPEKYIKKASLLSAMPAGKSAAGQPSPKSVSRFEDAFAADVAEPATDRADKPAAAPKSAKKKKAADPPRDEMSEKKTSSPSDKPNAGDIDSRSSAAKLASRAASLLKLGQNLEKAGKTTAATEYYRRIVKEFARTPSAKTAEARLKALDRP